MELKYQKTTPLAANAVLTSQWFDNGGGGAQASQFVRAMVYSDQSGTLLIQQVDDPALSKLISNAIRSPISGAQARELRAAITARYWRLIYTNGPVAQTSFQLTATASADLTPAILEELQRLNLQILALRGRYDSGGDEFPSVR